jgi:MFS family permease
MNAASRKVQTTYLTLLLLNTLAASFIWGVNTLFLLDAGLSNVEAFAANAFFTLGSVLFEVPTGVVADTQGRRTSYLLGTLTLAVATLVYLLLWQFRMGFWAWAITSVLLGLGFTFFSGAVEAWLVDALTFTGFFKEHGKLEKVLAKGEIVEGVAMLGGSVAGGAIAQATSLGVPYMLRVGVLCITFVVAFLMMRDIGFEPSRGKHALKEVRRVLKASIEQGLGNPPVRWVMLAAPFSGGVMVYAFYAMQPYLLELWGDKKAYGVAGLAAAIVAGAQIVGGLLVPYIARVFERRTTVLLLGMFSSAALLAIIGLVPQFWVVTTCLVFWSLLFASVTPVRQAYLNGLIASKQRATVLSFDNLFGSSGGVVAQPALGKIADISGYPLSYVVCAGIQACGLPFLAFARRLKPKSDSMAEDPEGEGDAKKGDEETSR